MLPGPRLFCRCRSGKLMREICILKAGRHADRAGFASPWRPVAMYGPAVKRCLDTACRGECRGLQTSPRSRQHAMKEAAGASTLA